MKWIVHRAHQAGPLSALGRLLFPLVAVAALRAGSTHIKWFQGSPLMRVYLRAARRQGRPGRHHLRTRDRRDRSDRRSAPARRSASRRSSPTSRSSATRSIIGTHRHRPGRLHRHLVRHRATTCVLGDERRDARPHRHRARHTEIGACEIWDGSPARKVGMVDIAALRRSPKPARCTRAAQTCLYSVLLLILLPWSACCRSSRPSGCSTASTTGSRRRGSTIRYLWHLRSWPGRPRSCWWSFTMVAHRRAALDRAAARARGPLFGPFLVLRPQMDGGAGDRGDAGNAVLALRHHLHARLVPHDGRQGSARARRSRPTSPAATTSSRSARATSSPTRSSSATRTSGAAGCAGKGDDRRLACSSATTRVVPPGAVIPDGALIGIKSKPPANDLMSGRRHLVRLAADQAADAPEVRCRRRQLDLQAAAWRKSCARVFEAVHTSFPTMLFITFGTSPSNRRPAVIDGPVWVVALGSSCALGVVIAVVHDADLRGEMAA